MFAYGSRKMQDKMERTLSVNYRVLRQNKGELLNTFEKHQRSKDTTLYINTGKIDRIYRKEYIDCGFLRKYSIIHPYFALVQGNSH